MVKKRADPPPIEPREFRSTEEIDLGVAKIQRRIKELELLDIHAAVLADTGGDRVARSNIRETIRDVFGPISPEFNEHQHIDTWAGGMYMGMQPGEIIECKERGRTLVIGILNGLIDRLNEKRADLTTGAAPKPSTYFDRLNLPPRVLEVSGDLFHDGYHGEAVFATVKALVNYIKERSRRDDLDGAT